MAVRVLADVGQYVPSFLLPSFVIATHPSHRERRRQHRRRVIGVAAAEVSLPCWFGSAPG